MTDLGGDYPETWDDFIGQEQAKRQLLVATRSAKMRDRPMDHLLLASGMPGIGKTSLALLTGKELGRHVQIVSGKLSSTQARILLSGMEDGDVLFYDEIHQAVAGGKAQAEWLLHLLQDGAIVGPHGLEEQPKVTVIGATTDAGRLPETILGRFVLQPPLTSYTELEAGRIALKLSERIFEDLPLPSTEVCYDTGQASSQNPRLMRSILVNLRDLAIVNGKVPEDGSYDLDEALAFLGLTRDGLTPQAQAYLRALLAMGGTAGERAIADRLNEPGGVRHTERLLAEKDLIAKTRLGRQLTKEGIARAKAL
jgi:Holliday junction DNA helicase RuvB